MVTGMDAIEQETKVTNEEEAKFDIDWGVTILQQGDMMQLTKVIINGHVVAVSNGSFQEQQGSAAWTIEGTTSLHCIVGQGRTPGTTNDQSTYCSKLFGLWGMLRMILNFTEARQIQTGKITITCDGLSALQQAKSSHPTDPAVAHYDLIGAIHQLKRKFSIDIELEHVKGHQDTGCTTVLP